MTRFVGSLFLVAAAVCTILAGPSPLTTKEISLMLRSGYSNHSILRELAGRGFGEALDSNSENQLVGAGANSELISALKSAQYRVAATPAPATKVSSSARLETPVDTAPSPATQSSPPPAAPTPPPDAISSRLKGDLIHLHQGSIVPFDDDVLENKKFYMFFFSASWNLAARKFTPQLVEFYNRVAPEHPEFELIFFSGDRSQFAMETYVTQAAMPWPAVAYDKLSGKAGDIQKGLVKEIPELVFAEGTGKVLAYSHSGDNPVELEQVLAEADQILNHPGTAVGH